MAEEAQQKSEIDASVGPTGLKFNLKNVTFEQIKELLKGIGFVALLAYVVYMFHEDHKEIAQTMQEMTYVVSLPPDSRGHLKLSMPESLRDKIEGKR